MLKYDCSHFSGDKPCRFHKDEGIKCNNCTYYNAINFKILIIKLDATGDVLRTTSVLPPLKKKYPDSHITWCTRLNTQDIFINNNFVDDLIFIEEDAFFRLNIEKYELVVNLDTTKFSSSIASSSSGKQKVGFLLNKKGYVEPTSDYAKKWLLMSAFDDVKKENKLSYQKIIYHILELDSNIALPVLNVPKDALKKISSLSDSWGLVKNEQIIGLNLGVGTKWPSKSWPLNRWEELIKSLQKESFNLMLLGGLEEKERMSHLAGKYEYVINTGCNNSVMEFAAIVNLCDILITADTFALHVGNALSTKIVALFGPTSDSEIYLYDNGIKVVSAKECKCYYKRECTEPVSCMSEIKIPEILKAVNSLRG